MTGLLPRALLPLLLCLFLVPIAEAEDTLTKGWYLMRGRANMQIGNYAAAIEAWEKYLELEPENREALKRIAEAHELQGQTDKAIAHYDRYLEVYQNDAETAFRQADYLTWSRYAYRKPDAIRYLAMGLALEDNPEQRLKYARLLAADRYDLDAAVAQYERLLSQTPEDAALRAELRAILLWDDRFLDKAIREYEYLVERKPTFEHRRQLAELLARRKERRREAATLYAALVQEKPRDTTLRHDYARVLAKTAPDSEETHRQYRQLVDGTRDKQIRLEAAGLLARSAATRDEAIEIYGGLLAENPADNEVRLARAALLLNERETAPRALDDYREVIARSPRNAEAHRGAAEALAWLGESDEALYHANLATRYAESDRRNTGLRNRLRAGREPSLAPFAELLLQSGDEFDLDGLRIGVEAELDPTPFISLIAATGTERYDNGDDEASGSWWRVRGQYRPNAAQYIDLELGKRSVREIGSPREFDLAWGDNRRFDPWLFRVGYQRRLVTDSYLSLVGDTIANLGGATRDELYAELSDSAADRDISYRAALGQVDSRSETGNAYLAAGTTLIYPSRWLPEYETRMGLEAGLQAYDRDHSGFVDSATEPRSGGYFSPQGYVGLLGFLELTLPSKEGAETRARIGPKLQYLDDAGSDGELEGGIAGSISYTREQSKNSRLALRAEHDAIGDAYRRTLLSAQLIIVF